MTNTLASTTRITNPAVDTALRSWYDNYFDSWGDDLLDLIEAAADLFTFNFGTSFVSKFHLIPEDDSPPSVDVRCQILNLAGHPIGSYTATLDLKVDSHFTTATISRVDASVYVVEKLFQAFPAHIATSNERVAS